METPKAGWTQTTDVVKWAEEISTFLSREKLNAERCMLDCQSLLDSPNVKSDSLRDGLRELMAKTEDNFGTLLHLERVINMKNHGDYSQPSVRKTYHFLCTYYLPTTYTAHTHLLTFFSIDILPNDYVPK